MDSHAVANMKKPLLMYVYAPQHKLSNNYSSHNTISHTLDSLQNPTHTTQRLKHSEYLRLFGKRNIQGVPKVTPPL